MGAIDRRKHDIDVMERVLGGARDEFGASEPHTEVVDIGIHPWLAGSTTSVVQVTVTDTRQPYYTHDEPRGGGYNDHLRPSHAHRVTGRLHRRG